MTYTYDNKTNFSREIYIETNNDRLITFISENCCTILGYEQDELINKSINNYISTIPKNTTENFEGTFLLKNGTSMVIDVNLAPIIDSNGALIGLKLSLIDISKYKKINNDEKRIVQMFERSKDLIYRLEVYPDIKFTYLSPSVTNILGYPLEDHIVNPCLPFEIVHPHDKDYVLNKLTGNFDFSTPKSVQYRHKDGHSVWLEDYTTPIYDAEGNYIAFEGVARDVTERKELEDKLERLSFYDGLTGLYNKLYIEKLINILNTEEDSSIGIIFCDLNNLKITNNTLGHEFGDKLIIYAANILTDIIKENCIAARAGGDEFIIIIKDTSLDEVKILHYLLCDSIEHQNKFNKELPISISTGYSFSESSIGVIRQVINIADKNMYKDKQRQKLTNIKK